MNFCTTLAFLFSSLRYWRYWQKRQLRCVKIGIYRTIRINCLVGKVPFAFLNGDHPESSIKCFQYPENIFDAITTGGVRKIAQRKKCLWIFCYSIGLCWKTDYAVERINKETKHSFFSLCRRHRTANANWQDGDGWVWTKIRISLFQYHPLPTVRALLNWIQL